MPHCERRRAAGGRQASTVVPLRGAVLVQIADLIALEADRPGIGAVQRAEHVQQDAPT